MTDVGIGQRAKAVLHWLIRSRAAYAMTMLFGLALTLPGLRTLPAVDRDEARFAQSSRQMLASGDYLNIRLQDEPRLKKPVGIYWLQAAATATAGGEDPANPIWTYRLPSVLGALGAMLTTLAIGRAWFGVEAAFAGAALLGASLLLGFEARQAKTDAVLLWTILIAIGGLAGAWMPGKAGAAPNRRSWIAFWAALGAGVLIKGPVILMVAGLTALTLSLLDRQIGWMGRLRPWPGMLVMAAVALPWLVAISISTHGAFLSQSLGGDMAAKLAGGQESHGAPPGTYLALFPLTFWPGSLFALAAMPWVWSNRHERSVRFALAWIVPSWIVFEIIPTKLPHYVLPLYPAIALLAGGWLARPEGARDGRWSRLWPRAAIVIWVIAGIVLGGAVIAAAPLGDDRFSWGGAGAALAFWAVAAGGAWAMRRGGPRRALGIALAGAVACWGLTFGAALPALDAPWIAPRLKDALFEKMPAGHGPVIIAGFSEPSAVIALGAATRFGSGGDAARLLATDPDAVAIVGDDQSRAFEAAVADSPKPVVRVATIRGFNYAKGKRVILTIWRNAS